MDVQIRHKGAFSLLVYAEGKINLETAADYGAKVQDAIIDSDEDIKELLLDFSKIEYISSIGLKVILELYKEIEVNNGSMKILNASDELKKSFIMVGFDRFLEFE